MPLDPREPGSSVEVTAEVPMPAVDPLGERQLAFVAEATDAAGRVGRGSQLRTLVRNTGP